jgi:predicted peptidase
MGYVLFLRVEVSSMKHPWMTVACVAAAVCMAGRTLHADAPAVPESVLARAGKNRGQIEKALADALPAQQEGMRFLVANMPDRDLASLSAEFLLENTRLAYQAWDESPWKEDVPKAIFLNDVLPYANVNERRDNWREDFHKRFRPLVQDARSPSAAAAILNQKVFALVGVRYSTKRQRPDQSPHESIESGLASCTGLSILLVDACRAVGVPARFAGTPLWTDKSGNHSWVEVWDRGWHFTGAAEPTGDRLDEAWFVARAAAAPVDDPQHAIYAVSYRRTPLAFPVVWDRTVDYVFAENVTDRYTRRAEKSEKDNATTDERASRAAVESLEKHLALEPDKRPPVGKEAFAAVPLTREDAARTEKLLWEDHVARIRRERAEEMKSRVLVDGDLKMPFFYRVFGERPEPGRAMVISMHGGGGAPKEVNDQQWENQKHLYRLEEGVYVVPRGPTDTWNLWHQEHIDRLFARLIEDMIVFEDVDPDRVYLMGYSAGGDGVFQLAPRMADRFAAAAMMAGHPNETSPLGLRNLPFTLHVGGRDAAYHRNEVAREWERRLAELHKADPDGYVYWAKIYPDKAHWLDREDAAAIPWMAKYRRNAFPSRIVWKQDDVTHDRFYWLAVDTKSLEPRAEVTAQRDGQRIDVRAKGVKRLTIRLNDLLVDIDKPVVVVSDDKPLFEGRSARTIGVIDRTLGDYGDPKSVYRGEVTVELPAAPAADP